MTRKPMHKALLANLWFVSAALQMLATGTSTAASTPLHDWTYITYSTGIVVGFGGNRSEGLRLDFLLREGKSIKTARLHWPDGRSSEPSWADLDPKDYLGSMGLTRVPATAFFPWGTNGMQEAWLEVAVDNERYWIDVPYGFTCDPREPVPPDEPPRPLRLPSAMAHLAKEDKVVRWVTVRYDLGLIHNAWRLLLIQPSGAGLQVELYKDDSTSAWDLHSPKTRLRVGPRSGTASECAFVSASRPDPFRRVDTFLRPRLQEKPRAWYRVEIDVDDKTYATVVPGSLFD